MLDLGSVFRYHPSRPPVVFGCRTACVRSDSTVFMMTWVCLHPVCQHLAVSDKTHVFITNFEQFVSTLSYNTIRPMPPPPSPFRLLRHVYRKHSTHTGDPPGLPHGKPLQLAQPARVVLLRQRRTFLDRRGPQRVRVLPAGVAQHRRTGRSYRWLLGAGWPGDVGRRSCCPRPFKSQPSREREPARPRLKQGAGVPAICMQWVPTITVSFGVFFY